MANQTKKQSLTSESKQVGRFGIIGVINTVIDFGLYNLLFAVANLAVIPSNIISASVAMSFSFLMNKTWVFRSKERSNLKQALIFIAVTAFSVYVIQNVTIYFFKFVWPAPFELAHEVTQAIGLKVFTQEFVVNNGAKALAVGFGMVWNYLWYKKVVFRR